MSATAIAVHSSHVGGSGGAAAYIVEQNRNEECLKVIQSYDSKTATVEQMQDYSECVQRLYPNTMHPEVLIAFKVLIVCSFIFWVVISWINREYCDSLFEAIGMGFIITLGLSLIMLFVFVMISILFM